MAEAYFIAQTKVVQNSQSALPPYTTKTNLLKSKTQERKSRTGGSPCRAAEHSLALFIVSAQGIHKTYTSHV